MRWAPLYLVWRGEALAQMEVYQGDLDGFLDRFLVGDHELPLAGPEEIGDVGDAIEGEEPHEKEVVAEAGGDFVADVPEAVGVEPIGEEAEEREGAGSNAVDLVGVLVGVVGVVPVDEEPAPDHGEEDGEVDPVHPADG